MNEFEVLFDEHAPSALEVTRDDDGGSGELEESLVEGTSGLALAGGMFGTGCEGKRGEIALAEVGGDWRLCRLLLGGIRSTASPSLAVVASLVADEDEASASRNRLVDVERVAATGEDTWLVAAARVNAVVGVCHVLSAAGVGMVGVGSTGSAAREEAGKLEETRAPPATRSSRSPFPKTINRC